MHARLPPPPPHRQAHESQEQVVGCRFHILSTNTELLHQDGKTTTPHSYAFQLNRRFKLLLVLEILFYLLLAIHCSFSHVVILEQPQLLGILTHVRTQQKQQSKW